LNDYHSSSENLELNKNTFKKLVSNFKKEKILDGIEYQGIKFTADEKTRYSLFIKKLSNLDTVNYKSFNKYYTLTKEQIIEICDMIEERIQDCFDWEMKIYQQIESCKKITDFLNIKL
jgi:DNA-binding transcriptional regulator YhcF (GntR family)